MNHPKKKRIIVAGLLLTCMLIVAACGTSQSESSSATPTDQATQANATLSHVATGTSQLKWDAASKTLTVDMSVRGLAPKSTHPEHIHKGPDCNSDGPILFSLNPLTADDKGVATSHTTITGDDKGIPDKAWYINVHNGGDGLTPPIQASAITCGNIANAGASTSSDQSAQVLLGSTPAPNEAASGSAKLSIANGKLTVAVTVGGLAPTSSHIAHIHTGSCEAQGAVKFPLSNIVVDANGVGTSTTTVDGVSSIPASQWYVNVHLAGTKDDASTQTGDDPIACGDVATV